jgi:hypothetical protein
VATALAVLLVASTVAGVKGTGTKVIVIVVGCLLVAVLMRWTACAVIADRDGLTVRNPLRTYRIAYGQIAGISQGAYTAGPTVSGAGGVVAIKLKDGTTVRASALITYIASPRKNVRRYSDGVIADLLHRTQAAAPGILDQPAHLP